MRGGPIKPVSKSDDKGKTEEIEYFIDTLSIERVSVINELKRRSQRIRHCKRLPFAFLVYFLLCWTIVYHARLDIRYDMESALLVDVIEAGEDGFMETVTSSSTWYDYFANEWMPYVIDTYEEIDDDDLFPGSNISIRISDVLLTLGTARFAQTRSPTRDCLIPELRTLYGPCHPSVGPESTEIYANMTEVAEHGLTDAFLPRKYKGMNSFVFELDFGDGLVENTRIFESLQAIGWIDVATRSVTCDLYVLNGETGYVGHVNMRSDFRRGGLVENSYTIGSVPISPYFGDLKLMVLDICVLVYTISLFIQFVSRIYKSSCSKTAKYSFGYWALLDTAVFFSLAVLVFLQLLLLYRLSDLGIESDMVPEDIVPGDPRAEKLFRNIEANIWIYDKFRVVSTWVIIFATMRIWRYFLFQPRTAVFVRAFITAAPHIAHSSLAFGVLLIMFGVWGHVYFGAQAPDWSTIDRSIVSLLRFVQYDFDLEAMEAIDRPMAGLYFAAVLYLVTNLTVWMFFGVIMETQAQVRAEVDPDAPTLVDEAREATALLWEEIKFAKREKLDTFRWNLSFATRFCVGLWNFLERVLCSKCFQLCGIQGWNKTEVTKNKRLPSNSFDYSDKRPLLKEVYNPGGDDGSPPKDAVSILLRSSPGKPSLYSSSIPGPQGLERENSASSRGLGHSKHEFNAIAEWKESNSTRAIESPRSNAPSISLSDIKGSKGYYFVTDVEDEDEDDPEWNRFSPSGPPLDVTIHILEHGLLKDLQFIDSYSLSIALHMCPLDAFKFLKQVAKSIAWVPPTLAEKRDRAYFNHITGTQNLQYHLNNTNPAIRTDTFMHPDHPILSRRISYSSAMENQSVASKSDTTYMELPRRVLPPRVKTLHQRHYASSAKDSESSDSDRRGDDPDDSDDSDDESCSITSDESGFSVPTVRFHSVLRNPNLHKSHPKT